MNANRWLGSSSVMFTVGGSVRYGSAATNYRLTASEAPDLPTAGFHLFVFCTPYPEQSYRAS